MGLLRTLRNRSEMKQQIEEATIESIRLLFEMEYEAFRNRMLNRDKECIFESAAKIRFYENIHDYIQSEDTLDYETATKINTMTPISELWDTYLSSDYLSVDSFEDISELFEETFTGQKGGVCFFLNVAKETTDRSQCV